jgi:putative DNA primase/helicase
VLRQVAEGQEREVDAEELTLWRSEALRMLRQRANGDRKLALLEYLAMFENGRELYEAVLQAERPASVQFPSYADLDLPPIEWCWPGWLPNGLLTLLAAPPGVGKSIVALDLARRLIEGVGAPDGTSFSARSCRVLYVDAEDMPRSTKSRGEAWGMDLGQIFPMLPPEYGALDLEGPEDRDRLIEMAHTIGPGLVVVDSFSRITARGDSSVEEVRPVLAFLKGLAKDLDCALLLVHHTRKRMANMLPGVEMTMDDVRGSGDIAAASRVIWGLSIVQTGPQADLNGPRKLSVLKSNIGRVPDALGCEWEPVGEDIRVVWGGAPEVWHEPTESDHCGEWLVAYLQSEGATRPKQIVEDADAAGYSRSTVYKARRELGPRVENTKGARSPNNEWRLAVEEGPAVSGDAH